MSDIAQIPSIAEHDAAESYWLARHSKSIISLIIALAVVGIYLALTIP